MFVMCPDESMNFIAKLFDAGKNAPMNGPALQLAKPAFYGIQPRSTGRREMQNKPGMLSKPFFDLRGFVCAAVIQNDVQGHCLRRRAIDLAEKIKNLLSSMPFGDPADYLARENVKGGVQAGSAVPLVIMSPTLDLPRL